MTEQEAVKKYGTITAAAKALGIAQSTLSDRLKRASQPKGDATGRSLSEFRATHDKSYIVPKKIRDGLAKLGEGWEYEMNFAKLAGISLSDLAAFRSLFEEHLVVVDRTRRAWAGTKATAAKMRAMV